MCQNKKRLWIKQQHSCLKNILQLKTGQIGVNQRILAKRANSNRKLHIVFFRNWRNPSSHHSGNTKYFFFFLVRLSLQSKTYNTIQYKKNTYFVTVANHSNVLWSSAIVVQCESRHFSLQCEFDLIQKWLKSFLKIKKNYQTLSQENKNITEKNRVFIIISI